MRERRCGLDVTLDLWVDNFLYDTEIETMENLIQRFEGVCDLCNVECKPSDTMDAIGLHFDVTAADLMDHFVEIQESFRLQML